MNDLAVPASVRIALERAPTGSAMALLLRHSARGPIRTGELGNELPLTPDGVRIARELGRELKGRLRGLHTSPVRRCWETAEVLRSAAGARLDIVLDRLLGDPGVLVEDAQRSWQTFCQFGHERTVESLMSEHEPLAGFAAPGLAVRRLVSHMVAAAVGSGGLHVFVTHDYLVTVTAAVCFGEPLPRPAWPRFLEGIAFWRANGALVAHYQDRERVLPWS